MSTAGVATMHIPMEGEEEQIHNNPLPSPTAERLAQAFFKPLGVAPEVWEVEAFDELLKTYSEEVITEIVDWARTEPFWGPLLEASFLRRNFRKILLQCRSAKLCKTKTTKPLDLPGRKASTTPVVLNPNIF